MATLAPDDPHNPKLGKAPQFMKQPHCIYFYYIGPLDMEGFNPILHYYDRGDNNPLNPTTLETKIEALIANARVSPLLDQLPQPIAADWKFPVWERISYIVFAIDIPGVILKQPELTFTPQYYGHYNWSFFDAQPAKLVNGCTVITLVNHMKADASFNEIGRAAQYFHFNLLTVPPLNWRKDRYPDSGGTNMGPPIGPP